MMLCSPPCAPTSPPAPTSLSWLAYVPCSLLFGVPSNSGGTAVDGWFVLVLAAGAGARVIVLNRIAARAPTAPAAADSAVASASALSDRPGDRPVHDQAAGPGRAPPRLFCRLRRYQPLRIEERFHDRRAGRARFPRVSVPGVILGHVATVTMVTVARSGPAIRAALAAYAPEEEARFTGELRDALAQAGQDLDLAGPYKVLRRWHARAVMAANPLTAEEQTQLERAKAGDVTGFSVRHDDGSWTTL